MGSDNGLFSLNGKTVMAVWLSDDSTLIRFDLKDDTADAHNALVYQTDGDCCSESWINDIIGVKSLIGKAITNVANCGVYPADGTRQEFDQVYKFTLTTDAGFVDIIFRNSSDGCYGGWLSLLSWEGAKHWIENGTWRQITEDYSA